MTRATLLTTLQGELEAWLARQRAQRPLVVPNGKRWQVEKVGTRVVFVDPDGVAYVQAEATAEPDVIIDWRGQRMVLPPLRLRRFDHAKALRRVQRAQRQTERVTHARRTRRRRTST